MKPTPELVEQWRIDALNLHSSEMGISDYYAKLCELAAAWGAKQAQQPTVEEPDNVRHVLLAAMIDIGAVLNGNYDEDHLEKTCTKIAAILYGRAPSRAFEPELPEPVAWTYQNRYTDQHYLTWSKSDGGRNWEPLYTTAQMHAFADAKVRAGAAGATLNRCTLAKVLAVGVSACANNGERNMDILEFQGEHRWLSNFWPAQVLLDGKIFPSVEHAFQAAKTHPSQRGPFRDCTAWQAKRLGRTVEVRADWEQVKVPTMRSLIEQKFAPGTELGEKLKATGDCRIVEGNHWGDVFWGVCKGRGQNWLGRLLMERRAFLQAPNAM